MTQTYTSVYISMHRPVFLLGYVPEHRPQKREYSIVSVVKNTKERVQYCECCEEHKRESTVL